MRRIVKLYDNQIKRRNLRFVFLYLKECYTLSYSSLTNNTYEPKVRISVDSKGIPKIIPSSIRSLMMDDRKLLVGVQTILAVHRAIP
jgi:hypothetical protein